MNGGELYGVIVFVLVIALLPAWIAHRKGQGFWTFYVFGVLLWIVAMPVALLVKDMRPRCPECAEVVRAEAIRCPHCQVEFLEPSEVPASPV